MMLIPTQRQFADLGLNAPKRDGGNPYHDENGQFTSAGNASGVAASAAQSASSTVSSESYSWRMAAKTDGMQQDSPLFVRDLTGTAAGHLDSASYDLRQAEKDGSETSKEFASHLGNASGYLADAATALENATYEFKGGSVPESLQKVSDSVAAQATSVLDMYHASMASSGYDPTVDG